MNTDRPTPKDYELAVSGSTYRVVTMQRTLRHRFEQIEGKLLIIWNGSPIHRSQAIEEFLASGAAARIHLERLPTYAPELNPDEGIWYYLKQVELKTTVVETWLISTTNWQRPVILSPTSRTSSRPVSTRSATINNFWFGQ